MKDCKSRKRVTNRILVCILIMALCISRYFLDSGEWIVKAANSYSDWKYGFVNGGVVVTKYIGNETEVSIPKEIEGMEVVRIESFAFENCTALKSVVIPDSVTSIDFLTFSNCTNLQSIEIPNSVTDIQFDAFSNCTSLESIEIPDSVTYIGNGAFRGCTSLRSIVIPDGITRIETRLLSGCTSLKSISIPDDVTSIGSDAFKGCTSLSSIVVPDNVTNIGDDAFRGCINLTSVVMPESINYIDGEIFMECPSNLVVYAPENSYAAKYAAQYGITTMPEKTVTVTPTPAPIVTPAPSVVEKEEQYITADSIQKEYGSKPFYLDAETDGDGELSFESSNENVATISWSGKVSIKNYGKSTITIWAEETDSYYDATEEITITVVPKKASVTKVSSPAKRQVSFTWKKDNSVTGYQIECSPSKSFGKETIQRVIGNEKNTTKTPPLLKSGKKYYVRVRGYKKVGTKKYYGKWSAVKSIKVK